MKTRYRYGVPTHLGVGMVHDKIIDRINNWRRFFRATQTIHSVPYYQPPPLGDVHEEEVIVRLPISLRDALLLENCWRNLDNQAYKYFIKYEYIARIPHQVTWRKLKHYGIRIKNNNDHMLFNWKCLDYFNNIVGE